MIRLLICGDREWKNRKRIEAEILILSDQLECIIEGDARGADQMAGAAALAFKIPLFRFPADWKTYGRAAGPIRNQQMLDEGKPSLVLAFHSNISQSRGTADMVRRAKRVGIETRVISS